MNYIGQRIYYDLLTGNGIIRTGEFYGETITQSTIEQDFQSYKELAERVPSTVGVIQLEYGQYAEDFAQSNGYRVDVETGEILFSYPDPSEPEAPPVYRKPLSVQVDEQNDRLSDIELMMADLLGI